MKLPMQLRWIVLLVVVVWVGGGIMFQSPADGDVNPVQAASPNYIADSNLELMLTADGPRDLVGCLKNCWFAGSSASKLVLYQDRSKADDRYYYGLVGQYGDEWHRTHEQSLRLGEPGEHGRSMTLMVTRLPEGHSWMYRWGILQDYAITVGKVDPEQVSRVDLVHNTGEITTPALIGNYVVSFAPAAGVCEAIAIDHQGQVIQTLDHSDGSGLVHTGRSGAMQPCD